MFNVFNKKPEWKVRLNVCLWDGPEDNEEIIE